MIIICDICLTNPCYPGCPNAAEEAAVETCCRCHDGILEGEEYLDSDEGPICENCLSDMTLKEYLDFVGEKCTIAYR